MKEIAEEMEVAPEDTFDLVNGSEATPTA